MTIHLLGNLSTSKEGVEMKITAGEISSLKPEGLKNQNKTAPGGFQEILDEKMSNKPAEGAVPARVPPMNNIDRIRFDTSPELETKQILASMDSFLVLLETYQRQMGDPLVSLKETALVVSRMEQQSQELYRVWEALPEGEEKDLLNRMLVTSTVETIKFNRGDYL